MSGGPGREIVRDLLWKNIRLEPAAARVVDTPPFQRLRYVRQLGHAFLVYPGATHSRFEHALGAYHLTRRALDGLAERGDLDDFQAADALLVRLGALLHDIGTTPSPTPWKRTASPTTKPWPTCTCGGRPSPRPSTRRASRPPWSSWAR